eukprot:2721749-Pyramimonas_sp.AAC.1
MSEKAAAARAGSLADGPPGPPARTVPPDPPAAEVPALVPRLRAVVALVALTAADDGVPRQTVPHASRGVRVLWKRTSIYICS